ncbi:MAG: hypothetical protein LBG99_00335, partial [Propionibacteriaceae bacterium]|nr:hypothetical protein [Propionibacteriaceae bacterium]
NATTTSTSITYNLGDGNTVTCHNPGTPRPWNPNDPLTRTSPTGCQHTYTTTNQLGNPNSRYTVNATVTWTTTWTATTGQSGTFTTTTTSTNNPTIHIGELTVIQIPNPGE